MNVTPLDVPDVLRIEPMVFGDDRGWFCETFHDHRYQEHGIGGFVQDNLSKSTRGILRGLHIQHPHGQGKLVTCPFGEVFDVAVDVRVGSPTFGRWVGARLSEANHHQLWIPPGFAHGFQVLSESALFAYKCTERYHPEDEFSVRWNDPAIGIDWPSSDPVLSDKDRNAPTLEEQRARLPRYES